MTWPHRYLIVSVDDHLVEPPDTFRDRASSRWADRMPVMTKLEHGGFGWRFQGQVYQSHGIEAVAGRPPHEWTLESQPFDLLDPAYVDPDARVAAMDRDGVWASLCFPSMWCGFAGRIFQTTEDPDLGLECVRAYNRWYREDWVGRQPQRFIPMQLPWIVDPEVGAEEIRQNAARGFAAVSFVDQPHRLGFPHISDRYWDPILRACEETDTVVCLHCGSGGWTLTPREDLADLKVGSSLFQGSALVVATDWIWAGVPVRFPRLRISLSEGGIGWVAMLLERLEYVVDHSANVGMDAYSGADVTPAEALLRNFWFCTIHDKAAMSQRHLIGVSNIMVETDYPHTDSQWPRTQPFLDGLLHGMPEHEIKMVTHANAAALFRHALPQGDP